MLATGNSVVEKLGLGIHYIMHTLLKFACVILIFYADFKSAVRASEAGILNCKDQCVWFVWSNGSHLNSVRHALISCTACSSFFILLDEQSACFHFSCFLRLACRWTVVITQLTLFTFRVFERSCFSLFRMANQPDFSLEP